ncbi:hypothetical protein DYB28_004815 [Aphanomyces astaci]|uniref:Uncharacterized protein n=1 Tax=Aphanomyces astaci TaxID=112090 RepID=A0A9X8DY81_APHAT|nr:hypothetical protein DYB28_004815 [Aphanomyces astaci]
MPFAAFSLAPSLPSVSHLTPACLYQSLARWSDVATSLSFIRAAAAHVGSIPASTLQGWSHALRAVVQDADRAVSTLMQLTMVETRRRPTLICLWVELQPLVDDAMWLRQVVLHMLEPCEHIQSPTTRHVTATVLSSLSGLLELYTVLDDTKHFVMLATWFRHAMKPYLARLDEFLQGHPAAVELGFESVSIATRGAFIQALFQSIQIPPSTAPPSFLVNMSSLVLEAHAYTILTRPETTPTTGSDMWDSVGDAMEQATLVSEHASMHEYLMQLVHHIVVYMACFEDILSEQLLQGNVDEAIAVSGLAAAASKFKRAHGYVIIALKSMATAGSASHLHELVLQLNYNRMFPVE